MMKLSRPMRRHLARLLSTNAAPLLNAEIDATSLVTLRWSDGLRKTFHPLWLLDNDNSRRHPSSRQKLLTPADLPSTLRVEGAEVRSDRLHIEWDGIRESSSFCARWLRCHGCDDDGSGGGADPVGRARTRANADAERAAAVSAAAGSTSPLAVPRISFAELRDGGDAARWQWLSALADCGATLVSGVPATVEASAVTATSDAASSALDGVVWAASLVGPIQPNIYGDTWDVISKGEHAGINLAYTTAAIGPHMDLCYYESPPGLQLLHCRTFDDDVRGGDSLLIDGFAVADQIRRDDPWAFEVLCRVPATFLKDHSRRAEPVLLSYQRPHLSVDPRSHRLTGLFWSPPFEGPLVGLTLVEIEEYYEAYRVLHKAIESAPAWRQRMAPGEMLVFNNRRMLHGRAAFEPSAGGTRHLRGGYVNIDEFANTYNLLHRTMGVGSNGDGGANKRSQATAVLGNQDWASGPIDLPPAEAQTMA